MGRTTISPQSKFLMYWDVVTAVAMLWTAFVTPFEVGFLAAAEDVTSPLFIVNRLIDTVFIVDMALAFFVPYRASQSHGGMLVFDNRKIAKRYLTSWFPLDLITGVPIDFIISSAMGSDGSSSGFLQMLRIFRIAKLARIARASRIYNRWIDYVGLSYAIQALVRFLVLTCVLAHWLACLWGFVGQRADVNAPSTWHARLPQSMQHLQLGAAQYEEPFALYFVCVYVALNNIFGGSCEINPNCVAEYFVQALMMLCGSCVWAYVIGSCCGILATLNPAVIEYRQTMDELNVFVKDHDLPQDLTVRLRSYFRNTMHLIRTRRYEVLLGKMSKRLRGDASIVVATRAFQRVSYLSHPDIESEFLCLLTVRFRLAVFSRLERIATTNLFIVDRGVCAKKGKVALVGSCFGEDMIVTNPFLRDTGDTIALTFVQTIYVTREAMFEHLPEFPIAYRIVRRAAYKLALRRFIVQAAAAGIGAAAADAPAPAPAMSVLSMSAAPAPSAMSGASAAARATVNVEDAVRALHQQQASLQVPNTPEGSAMAFGGVSVGLYDSKSKSSSSDASAAVQTALSEQGEAISTLRQEVGGLDAKLDAVQQQLAALLAATKRPPRMQRASTAAAPSKPLACASLGSAGPVLKPSTDSRRASEERAAAERDEMRDAATHEDGVEGGAASRSSPFDA